MSAFDLPVISPDANPEFTDAASCAQWLRTVPLINVAPSHSRILGQIEELNCFEVEPSERLRIMELLLEPATFVQAEHAKKFTAKPVPLGKPERDIFYNVLGLWDALSHGYRHCLLSVLGNHPALAGQQALVCQRALWCIGQRIVEHYKSFQEFSGEDWKLLHHLFATAEGLGILDKEVPDAAQKTRATSCLRTYVHSLLLQLANDPSEPSPKQLVIVGRWLEYLAQKVRIDRKPGPGAPGLAPLAVDLAAARGAVHETLSGGSTRHLRIDELAKSIRSRVALLRAGDTPEKLGLGDDVSASAAEQLLLIVHRQWCEEPRPRVSSRRAVAVPAKVCMGLSAIHYCISGKPFRQPAAPKELTKAQRDEIATFGHVSTREDEERAIQQSYTVEAWTITEESLGGLRISRGADGGKSRLVQRQLIGVLPADAKGLMVGVVRWLAVSGEVELRAGVRILPGLPRCVAVRATGLNTTNEMYVPALVLPAVPALQSPAALILPAGWYRPKRLVEVLSDKAEQILLTGILDRGADFERLSIGAP
ncbi:MAG: hypothetical protein A3H32_18825 [Betaproteobacteria bacterium RIFCSPLOWO2_02_FULL_63_19]|nr:MAG: hypothetical protein A3H32_18825 [Betaproteobacteria bacterium RIFCSPLOWO2_02_FULL_63_19]